MIRIILLFSILMALSVITHAAETRGLAVVAKDQATNQSSEVRLYNKSFAVVIGIDRYQSLPADRQLKNAVKDARGVQEVLSRRYQFDKIFTLYDEQATKDRIMELLTEELPGQMGRDDALFVFWAGHGNQEKSDYGDLGYLIPFDGSTDKIRKNLTMAELRDTISKKLPAKHVLYVMDACYSGLLTTRSVDNKTRRDLGYLKEITRESVRQVLTSGSKNEEALDGGPKGHSVFTGRFIELLENADDFITANELQSAIKEKVYSDAKARNHTQTPGFGSLYGLGDFVFVPIQIDKLGNLSGSSAARQKELEQLKKAEAEAAAAKQKEQQEIARKQAELDVLDRQIADMKNRLGSGAARGNDSLDSIIALAEEKEKQGERLEELKRQREAEERKRQQEIERLRSEALAKRTTQLKSDIVKYQKIASSKYAQDMKSNAWDALVTAYSEARKVPRFDVTAFLASQGLVLDNGEIITSEEKEGRVEQRQQQQRLQEQALKEEELERLAGKFVAVPAGCFSTEGTQVCLDAFRIGKYEVTQGQYKRIMGSNPSRFSRCGDDCPVERVSWDDTQSFISKLNNQTGKHYRLPSEAEWQYACTSGGKREEYCGGNNIDTVAWYYGNSGPKTHPVGQKQPNGLGIYDMSGNVWEWVEDWHGSNYPSSGNNPIGASSGSSRVNRGGSWINEAEFARATFRFFFVPDFSNYHLGFRLVSPVQ